MSPPGIRLTALIDFRSPDDGVAPLRLAFGAPREVLREMTLDDVDGGTRLTVVESGFEALPAARRVPSFTANSEGWALVVGLVEKYVQQTS